MRRGELYRTAPVAGGDPRRYRVYLVVSRQGLIDSRYSAVMCVPVYTRQSGLSTEVAVGPDEGLRHESCVRCDEIMSVPRARLHQYVGSMSTARMREVALALSYALDLMPAR